MKLEEINNKIPESFYRILKEDFKIDELRPAQEKAINQGLFENKNLLVCTPTASGKTLIAELIAIKTILERKGKVVYTVPLKALANEKYKDFKNKYEKIGIKIALSIGDVEDKESYLENYDLIICSNEKLDSLIRLGAEWLYKVKILIIDEIHLLDSVDRGPTLEILITIFRRLIKDIQIIALSATIGNPNELAEWLNASLIEDIWRPVKLYQGISLNNKIDFFDEKDEIILKTENKDSTINLVFDTVKNKRQALVFVNTRKSSEVLAENLSKILKFTEEEKRKLNEISKEILNALSVPTDQCKKLASCVANGVAYHHSGLVQKQREIIEDNFKKGYVKIICNTPTLAAGIEYPTDRVIIKDLKRYKHGFGQEWIPVIEYLQFVGRSGRPSYGHAYGESIVIAKTKTDKETIYNRYILGEPEEIISKLAAEPILRTYLLSLIATEIVNSEDSIMDFFKDTFYAYQFKDLKALERIIERMLVLLEDYEFIKVDKDSIRATLLGKRISQLYLDPLTAHELIEALKKLKEVNVNDFTFLHLICSTLEMRPLFNVSVKEYESIEESLSSYIDNLAIKNEFDDNYLEITKTALILKYWIEEKTEQYILENYNVRPGELNYKLDNADWLLYALDEIAKLIDREDLRNQIIEIKKLRKRLHYGIKEELLELVRLRNIGRVRARELYRNGFKTLGSLKIANPEILSRILGRAVAVSVKEQLGVKVKEEGLEKY